MPFFSTFSGSLSAGRRSKGVKNSPQSDAGSPKYPKDPRNLWFHLVANQAGEHRSDWRDIGDRDGTEIDIIEENTNGWNGHRDLRKGASGDHAIEDLGPYRITDPQGTIVFNPGTSNEDTVVTKNVVCTYGAGGSLNSSSTDARSNFTGNSTATTSYRSGYNEVFINMAGVTSWDTGMGGGQNYRKPGGIEMPLFPFMIYPGSDELNNGETIGEESNSYEGAGLEHRPFTLEFWLYMASTNYPPNQAPLFSTGSGYSSIKLLVTSTPKSMNMSSPGPTSAWTTVDNSDKFRNSTWHHIAITRDKFGHEGKLRSFIDGELIQYADCANMSDQFQWNSTSALEFGGDDLHMALFDDVRFIVGECVYGSANSFTPPNKKFEQSAVTVECHSDRLKESTGNANDFEFRKVDDTVFFHASTRRVETGHGRLTGTYSHLHFMNLANTHSSAHANDPRANTLVGWTPTYVANTQPAYKGSPQSGSSDVFEWSQEWTSGYKANANTAMGETSVEDTVYVGEITPTSGETPCLLFQGERDKAVEIVRPGLAAGFRGIHDFTVELCWKKVGDYPTNQTGKHDWPILRFQLDAGGDSYYDNNDDSTYVELRSSTELLTSTNPVDANASRFLTLANYPPTGAVGVVDDKVISSVGDHRGTETATGELSRYKWHHIAIVYQYEINTVSLYLDGVRTVKCGPTLGQGNWDWNDIEYLRYGWGCKIYELQMSAVAKYTGETYKLPDHPPFNGKKGIDYPISDEGIVFSHFNAYKEDNNRANTVWDHAKNRYMGDSISHEGDPDDPGGRGFLDRDFTARPRGSTPAPGSPTYGDPDLYTDITAVTGDSHDPTIRYCFERTANVADGDTNVNGPAIQFTKVIPGFDLTSNTGTTTGASLWGSSSQVGERPEGNTDDFPYDHYGPLMIDFWFVWKTDDATSSGPQDPFQDAYDFDGSTYIEVFSFGTAASNAAGSQSDRPFLDSTDRLRCEIQLWDTYDGRNVYSPKWKFTGINQNGSVTNAGPQIKVESKTVAQEATANSGAGIRDMHGNPFAPFRSELQPQEAEMGTWIYESIARFPYSEIHAGNTWFGNNQYGTSYTPNTYCNVEVNKPYHIKMGLSSSGWEYFYVNGRLLEAHHIPMQAEKTSGQKWDKEWGKRVNSKGEFHWRGVPQTWSYDRAVYNISAWDQARILQGIDKGSMSDIRISSYDIDATQFYIPEDAELKRLPSRPTQSALGKIAMDGALTQVGIDASKHPYSDASIASFYGPTVSTFTYDSTEVEGTKSTDEGIDVVNEYDRILKFSPSAGITEPSSRVLVSFSNGSDHRFDIYEGYTLEAWIYPFDNTYTPGTNNFGYQVIIDTRPASSVGGFGQFNPIIAFMGGTHIYPNASIIYAGDGGAGSSPFTPTQDCRSGVYSVPHNQWTHVAYTCIGDSVKIPASAPDWYKTTKRIWINGVLDGEEITDGLTSLPTGAYLDYEHTNIGQPSTAVSGEGYNDITNSLYKFKGYIQNARVSKGVKYLNSFTPPNLRDDMQWSRTTSP